VSREAASRVASLTRKLLEDVVLDVVNVFFSQVLDAVAYTAIMCWDEGLRILAERGLEDPDTETILKILEENADRFNMYESLGSSCGEDTKKTVNVILTVAFGVAKKFTPKELIEKFTYENVLKQAEKRGLQEVLHYLKNYPKLCTKIIDWIRDELLKGNQ
jgi:hypothetical protein